MKTDKNQYNFSLKYFLSHAHSNRKEISILRRALEDRGVAVWEDILNLRAGDRILELQLAVERAAGIIILLTPDAIGSSWVQQEVEWALEARKNRPEYRIILLLSGLEPAAATLLLKKEELVYLTIENSIEEIVPGILRALELLPAKGTITERIPVPLPLDELVIEFTDSFIKESDGQRRVAARFRIVHRSNRGRGGSTNWFDFVSPIGPLELEEIRWYLEDYPSWPFGIFRSRASKLEGKLELFGRNLFIATLDKANKLVLAWQASIEIDRRIVVEVNSNDSAAAMLMALPWELLADKKGYLSDGAIRAQVVRRLLTEDSLPELSLQNRLRILIVIARPEEKDISFLDPRLTTSVLIKAIQPLGYLAELEVLSYGTFSALRKTLDDAERNGTPFQIVHFDGHGVYDQIQGIGKLCFEDPIDADKNKLKRKAELITASKLGTLLRQRRVPLFVLEACQSAVAEEDITASIAGELLRNGVGSVIAMKHSVLVEAARRFSERFYALLAAGERIGTAVMAAQHYLKDEPFRGSIGGHGDLNLQDWFVPILFQEQGGDIPLVPIGIEKADFVDVQRTQKRRLGNLPSSPKHGFIGRGRELLLIQRLLNSRPRIIITGEGGIGKTSLAVEVATWLLEIRLVERVAFISVEDLPDTRIIIEKIGQQLVPDYSIVSYEGTGTSMEKERRARLPIERVLIERRVLIVVDNFESILPNTKELIDGDLNSIFNLLIELSEIENTRLLVTCREDASSFIDSHLFRMGSLTNREGRKLVRSVLEQIGKAPANEKKQMQIDELVEITKGHPRSLVLLTPLIAEQGIDVTRETFEVLVNKLEHSFPNQRERSLIASVYLSLKRLPKNLQKQLRVLAIFGRAIHVNVLAEILKISPEESFVICQQLISMGLAEAEGRYLIPVPGFKLAMKNELSRKEFVELEIQWVNVMLKFLRGLKMQLVYEDPESALQGIRLTQRDHIHVMEIVEKWVNEGKLNIEEFLVNEAILQELFLYTSNNVALKHLAKIRNRVNKNFEQSDGGDSLGMSEIEHKLHFGDFQGALNKSTKLIEDSMIAYKAKELSYRNLMVHFILHTKVLYNVGAFAQALKFQEMAIEGLNSLDLDDPHIIRQLQIVLSWNGLTLRNLGRLEEAADVHKESIEIAERIGDRRQIASEQGNLGIVFMDQGKLEESLAAHRKALDEFQKIGEPSNVAVAWDEIGKVYWKANQYNESENAYKKALAIRIKLDDTPGEGDSLNQLGVIYDLMGRLEEAAAFYQKSVNIFQRLNNPYKESLALKNLYAILDRLERKKEAQEIQQRLNEIK